MLKKNGFLSVISSLSSCLGTVALKKGLTFVLLALCVCFFVGATDFTWVGGGNTSNWSDTDNWYYDSSLGTDPDGYPNDASDSVNIAGANVSVTGSVTCGSITMTGTSSLTIGGHLFNTGAISAGGCDITLGSYEGADTTPRANIDCNAFYVSGEVIFRGYVKATFISVNGKITFGGAVSEITTSANQYYGGDVDINGTFLFTSTAGTITFNSNVRSWSPLAANLKPLNITGNVIFNTVVGRVDTGKGTLSSINVNGTTSVGGNVTTSGAQTYSGDVTVSVATALTFTTGENLTFGGNLTGNSGNVYLASNTPVTSYDIYIRGNISGVNDIYFNGPTFFDGSGTTASVTSVGYQHYNADVTLGKTLTMTATGGAGKYVSLKKNVIGGTNSLTITAANVNFGSGAGETVTGIGDLTVTATESIALNAETFESTGLQTYTGPTVLKTSVNYDIDNGEIVLNGAVDAGTASVQSLAFTGTGLVTIKNTIGASKQLSGFSVEGTTEIFSPSTSITTSGAQTYSGDVTVSAASLGLTATTASFGAKLDGATALSITGNAVFAGVVGSTVDLSSISVSGNATVGGNVTTSGAQTYSGNLTLTASSVFSASGGLVFGSSSANSVATGTYTLTANSGTVNSATFNSTLSDARVLLYSQSVFNTSNSFKSFSANSSVNSSDFTVSFADSSTQTFSSLASVGASGREITLTSVSGSTASPWKAVFSYTPTDSDFAYTVVGYSTSVTAGGDANELGLIPSTARLTDAVTSSPTAMTTTYWFTQTFVWNGSTDTSWTTVSNWQYSDGSSALTYPDYADGVSDITISNSASSTLILTFSVYVKSVAIGTSSGAASKINLANFDASTSASAALINYGTIILSGSGRFYYMANSAATPVLIMDNQRGTVEYDGTGGDVTDIHSGTPATADYYTLVIKTGSWTISDGGTPPNNIKAASSFTVENGATLVLKDTAVVNSELVNNGTLQVDGGGTAEIWANFTNGSGATVQNNGNLLFTADCQTVSDGGTWSFGSSGKISFANLNSAASFSENSTASTSNSLVFDTSSFNSNTLGINGVSGTALLKIASYTGGGTGTVNFSNVNFLQTSVSFTGTVALNDTVDFDGSFTVSSGQTSFGGDVSATNLTIANSARLNGGATGTVSLEGSWTNLNASGGFVPSTSSVVFNLATDSNMNLSGTETFYNLSIKNHKLTSDAGVFVSGSLAITDAGSLVGTALQTDSSAATTLNSVNSLAAPVVVTSGTQTYGGALTLGVDSFLSCTDVSFTSTVGGFFALRIIGNAGFDGVVTTAAVEVTGTTNINTASITTTGVISGSLTGESQRYVGNVSLASSTVLTAPATNLVNFGADLTDGSDTYAITVAGANVYVEGEVNIGGNFTAGGDGKFVGTVTCANLTVANNAIFASNVSSTASIAVSGTTTFSSITAQTVNSTSTQTYTGDVTVSAASLGLTATTATFGAKLDGATALSITGNAVFGGAVGSTVGLSSIAISGTSNIGADINTTGAQTYTGDVNFATSVSLTAPVSNLVTFGSDLTDGSDSYSITIVDSNVYVEGEVDIGGNFTAGGDAEFVGTVTCANLTVAGNSTIGANVSSSGSIVVTGTTDFSSTTAQTVSSTLAQTYTDLVNIGSDSPSFSSTGGNINFGTSATTSNLISGVSGYSFSVSTSGAYSTNFYGVIANNPSLTITGNSNIYATNTYTSLSAQGQAGKTLNFAAGTKQTVTQEIFLSGTEDTNLTLTSSGTWELILNPHTIADSALTYEIRYVDMQYCTNNTKNGATAYFLTAFDSNDNGNNVCWNFPGMVYVWEGDVSDDWYTAGNWNKNSIPGRGSVVTIPPLSAPAVYPLLSSDVDIAYPSYENLNTSYPGTITVQGTAEFDLYDCNVTSGSFTNNGLLRLFGTTTTKTQTILSTMVNGSLSTVEYYGTGITDFVWDGDTGKAGYQYQNLLITGSASISSVIGVAAVTTINTSGNVSLTAANVFTGDLGITAGGAIVLNSVSTGFSLSAGASCQSLSILSPVILKGDVTTTGSQTYASTVQTNDDLSGTELTFKGDIDVRTATSFIASKKIVFSKNTSQSMGGTVAVKVDSPSVTFANPLTLENPIGLVQDTSFAGGTNTLSFSSALNSLVNPRDALFSAGTVMFNSTLGETLALKILRVSGNAEFYGTVSTETVEVTGTTNINTASITTTGVISGSLTGESQRYVGNVSLASSTVLTAPATNLVSFGADLTDGSDSYSITIVDSNVYVEGEVNIGGNFTAGGDGEFVGTVTCANLTVAGNSTIGANVSSSGSIVVTGTTDFSSTTAQTVNSTSTQTYTGAMGISFGAKLRSGADILISSAVSGTGYLDAEVYGSNTFTSSALLGDSTALSSITITAGKLNLNGFNCDGQVVLRALPSTGTVFDSGTEENIIKMISGDYISNATQSFSAVGGVRVLNSNPVVWNANTYSITLLSTPLFVDSSSSLTLSSSLSASNIYFYSGSITSSSSITSVNDFAVWGASYSADDPRFVGVDSRFAFYGYDDLVYKASSNFATTLTLTGSGLTVGKNFYLNGADLSGANFSIPDNSQSKPVFNSTSSVTQNQWGIPYAVAFNSNLNNLTVTGGWLGAGAVDSETSGQTQGNTLTGVNANVQGDVPRIVNAYSVFDDVIYVEFNLLLENSNGEIATNIGLHSTSSAIANGGIFYSNGSKKIVGVYTDSDCTTPLTATAGDVSSFYVSAEETWNTDATGLNAYNSSSTIGTDSTDRSGTHKDLTTDLSMLEGLFTAADGHTMSRNYGAGVENSASPAAYTAVEDRTAPVLIAVYTGQEKHTAYDSSAGSQSQPDYDSHNFIEFRYSEAVNIGDLSFNAGSLNARATSSFANITEHGGHITGLGTQGGNGLTVTGFAELSSGKLESGSKDGSSPHALYRSFSTTAAGSATAQTHRIRLSVAGYVDGTVSYDSDLYKNWMGYIDFAQTPSGAVTRVANPHITDVAEDSLGNNIFNALDSTGTENHPIPTLNVNSTQQELYGNWDVLPPVIVPFTTTKENWQSWLGGADVDLHEIIGSSTGSYIETIEVHLFDNDKSQNSTLGVDYWWKSKKGWMDGIETLPDTFGGSRPFVNVEVTDENQTTGGIRRSSLEGENSSFSYIAGSSSVEKQAGTSAIGQVVRSSLFRSSTDNATASDGLYLSVPINSSDTYLPVRTAFTFYYDPSNSFITDLAGNRLSSSYSAKTSFSSIDLTPPAYVMNLAPIGHNKIYVIFTKRLAYIDANNDTYYFSELTSSQLSYALEQIKDSFIVCQRNTGNQYTGIEIDSVEYVDSSDEYTSFLFTLERTVTLTDVKELWLRNIGYQGETVGDVVTGDLISDTKIHDYIGNYLPHNKAHAISDFAVNAVDVLYAYASAKNDDGWNEEGLYGNNFESKTENYAVHDFSESQGNYGKLVSGREIVFRTRIIEALSGDSYISTDDTFTLIPANKSSITASMASDKLNLLTGSSWRLWLPSGLTSLASQANTTLLSSPVSEQVDASVDPTLFNYTFTDTAFNGGDEIQFLFRVDGVTIDHDADDDPGFSGSASPTSEVPLYAVWMPDTRIKAGDFSFVDLWSFGIKDQTLQKGGVSIFNNVINVNVREQTIVQVDMPRAGALNVFVMTLDGNIVKRLAHGRTLEGTHYFRWDGTNNAGNPVARGLYFVRVTGPGIDETRKVLAVKE